ncbi:MAG: IS1634 family transposase [Actinomycetota bacterium]|nr:IS1634 family transposase [Actinomycetota bacterium]
MYLRTTARRTKNGAVVRYLALAHNERNARGVPVAKVIHNLGREDLLDRAALTRLVASIQRFLGGEDGLRAGTPAGFKFIAAPECGGPHVVGELWAQLGVGTAISRVAGSGRGRAGVERAIFTMVCQRCLEPASKLEATRWAGRDVVIDGVEGVSDDQLYRAMDFLLDCSERVQESVSFSVASLLNLEVDVIFFDTTSTYFETDPDVDDDDEDPGESGAGESDTQATGGEEEQTTAGEKAVAGEDGARLRRQGHSKDHRPDLPQVVIGLAVTREGIPVRCWVWPGNTSDQAVVGEVKADLNGWRLGRAIYVVDSGFSGQKNLRALRSAGGHYIAGMKMRSGMKETEEALSRPGRYRTVAENLRVKDVNVGDGDAAQRFVICHNPGEAKRDEERRAKRITRIETELERLAKQHERAKTKTEHQAHHRGECALRDHKTLSKYVRQTKTGRLVLDQQKIKAEQRLDGKYLLTTSDTRLTAEEVALGYKKLLEAERSFRDLKGTLRLRPVFHSKDERIRSHVLICFLALVIIRVAENRTSETWRTIRTETGQIRQGHFHSPDGNFAQTTELTQRQQDLLRALQVPEPPRFGRITPA